MPAKSDVPKKVVVFNLDAAKHAEWKESLPVIMGKPGRINLKSERLEQVMDSDLAELKRMQWKGDR